MTSDYMFTAIGASGWRDIAVLGASDIREAIRVAERATGCMVSHGQGGGVGVDFHPNLTIYADTGRVVRHHDTPAKPEVNLGPPDVLDAIARALRPPKDSNTRTTRK